MNIFTHMFQGFWPQLQNGFFVENLWMALSVSVTFLLDFRSNYNLGHLALAAFFYSCSKLFRTFCTFFSICLSIKMSVLFMTNLNTFVNFKAKLTWKGFSNQVKTHFTTHKNQVELMKLKVFSPIGVEIKQFLFPKRLTYIKRFLQWYQIP